MTKTTRIPTQTDLVNALHYVEAEYRISNGLISYEQWAEGLAWGRDVSGLKTCDRTYWDSLVSDVASVYHAVSVEDWRRMAMRADYLRASEGHYSDAQGPHGCAPRYTEAC